MGIFYLPQDVVCGDFIPYYNSGGGLLNCIICMITGIWKGMESFAGSGSRKGAGMSMVLEGYLEEGLVEPEADGRYCIVNHERIK